MRFQPALTRGSHRRAGAEAARERKEILELQPHRIETPVNFRITRERLLAIARGRVTRPLTEEECTRYLQRPCTEES